MHIPTRQWRKLALTLSVGTLLSSCDFKEHYEPDLLGRFDRNRDLYLAHFDVKIDVDEVHSLAFETLNNGGTIWIADGGQSDFSAALIRKLRKVTPEPFLKDHVHIVQHADWNEEVTTAEDLAFVKEAATYHRIPSGNAVGNGSPGFRSEIPVDWEGHVGDGLLAEIWAMAVEVADAYNGADDRYLNEAIQNGGLDFSDVAETAWIFGFNDLTDANDFFEEFSGNKPH